MNDGLGLVLADAFHFPPRFPLDDIHVYDMHRTYAAVYKYCQLKQIQMYSVAYVTAFS